MFITLCGIPVRTVGALVDEAARILDGGDKGIVISRMTDNGAAIHQRILPPPLEVTVAAQCGLNDRSAGKCGFGRGRFSDPDEVGPQDGVAFLYGNEAAAFSRGSGKREGGSGKGSSGIAPTRPLSHPGEQPRPLFPYRIAATRQW